MKPKHLLALLGVMAMNLFASTEYLPSDFCRQLSVKRNTGISLLPAEGNRPVGLTITTDKALEPVYRIESSVACKGTVEKGDLIVFTAAVRGVARKGNPSVLIKFQDGTYTGALRDYITAKSDTWQWVRLTAQAPKDYAEGSLRLHVYPWTGAQQLQICGLKLENYGKLSASNLPPLPAAPKWQAPALKVPEGPKPIVLPPLSEGDRAEPRYCVLKLDDLINHHGDAHPRFKRVADYLASRKIKSGIGIIVRTIWHKPNDHYIAWIKQHAVANDGYVEFWNHGWDHNMFFQCKEDDDCDHTKKFHGEFGGTCSKHQISHLQRAQQSFKKLTGLTMQSFGAAGNAVSAETAEALNQCPEITAWLYGNDQFKCDATVLWRTINLEHAVGKIDHQTFLHSYQSHRMDPMVVLQGHPAMWSDDHFEEFKKVIDTLVKDGWLFVTPVELGQLIREGKVTKPKTKPAKQKVGTTPSEPTILRAGKDWTPLKATPEIIEGSALDFSAMRPTTSPAGNLGPIIRSGAHFAFAKQPEKPVRFYGVNLCFGACYPEYEESKALAKNLARLGYNSVRIHHHDGGLVEGSADATTPNEEQFKRLDGLVAACIENGLYLTTDLFISRKVPWRIVGIDADGKIPQLEYKALVIFHPEARENLKQFSRNFLNHVNPYTKRRYADEPALCALAIVNEGNLMNCGGRYLRHIRGCEAAWKRWLAEKQKVDPKRYGKVPDTIPENAYAWGDHTPAFTQFLREAETEFMQDMRKFLREEIRTNVLLSNDSSWWNPVAYQQLRADTFDYVDDHFYIDHPSFLKTMWQLPSKCPNTNPILGEGCGMTDVPFRRLLDRPFTITEYNYSGPGRFRGLGGIVTGTVGALQGWDGLWRFAWAHTIHSIRKPGSMPMGYFDMSNDPLSLAAERASICLYLRGDLPELKKRCAVVLPSKDLTTLDPKQTMNKAPWKWIAWYTQLGTIVGDSAPKGTDWSIKFPEAYTAKSSDLCKQWLGVEERPTTAGDGHIEVDNVVGSFTIKTPKTCGGFAEKGTIRADALVAEIDSPATVWASAIDTNPITSSKRILLTHLTDLQNSNIRYRDPELTILEHWGELPYIVRRGSAKISLKVQSGKWKVYVLNTSGKRIGEIPTQWSDGRLRFEIKTDRDPTNASLLYEIVMP